MKGYCKDTGLLKGRDNSPARTSKYDPLRGVILEDIKPLKGKYIDYGIDCSFGFGKIKVETQDTIESKRPNDTLEIIAGDNVNINTDKTAKTIRFDVDGNGDVVGPSGSQDEKISVFDGTTGKKIKDGGMTIAEIIAAAPQLWERDSTILSPVNAGDDVDLKTGKLLADIVNESTLNSGITLEGVLLKDGKTIADSVRTTFSPVYNVLNWDLVGDGSTDNSIQWGTLAAAVVAAGGGTIYFPAGTYKISTTSYDFNDANDIKIIGDGRNITTVDFSAAAIQGFYKLGNGSEVRNVKIKCQAARYAFYISDSITDGVGPCVIDNVYIDGGLTYAVAERVMINLLHIDQVGSVSGIGLRYGSYWGNCKNVYITGYSTGLYADGGVFDCEFKNIKCVGNTTNIDIPSAHRTVWENIYTQYGTNGMRLNGAASAYEGNALVKAVCYDTINGTTGTSGFNMIKNYSTDGTTWTSKDKDDYGTFGFKRIKITRTYADFSDAGSTKQTTVFSLPAGAEIKDVYAVINTVFSGGSISAYTISVGIAAASVKYLLANDVKTATGNIFGTAQKGVALSLGGVVRNADTNIESMSVATNVIAEAKSTGDTLNHATQGSIDIYIDYCEQIF